MMLLRSFLFLVIFLTIPLSNYAQADERAVPGTWRDKIGIGGNLGLNFGNITYVEVSPIAGYRINQFLMAGIGFSYRYYNDRYYNYSLNMLGGSVWARAYILPMVFAYAEHEELYAEFYPFTHPGEKSFLGTNFVGGGYNQGLGNVSTYIMVLFALNQDYTTFYQNPVIRVGIMFGGNPE
jgi:hypothetical protein